MEVGIEFVLYMVGKAKLLVVSLNIQKVKEEASKVFGKEWGDPLFTVLSRKPQKMAFTNSIYLVSDRAFTADSGLL